MDRSFRIDATIDSQPVRVMLDTGCARSGLEREVADRLTKPPDSYTTLSL